ncbi:hypothetical protein BgiBS90_031488 [Biomphalaria glabrata]|nr:hypothetical protein BgiBS90_031487 [Biomphalaria glabrata]KAI8759458.1 hypothetical protein BgiBS90_031488 [Biomphalaria glabrata]
MVSSLATNGFSLKSLLLTTRGTQFNKQSLTTSQLLKSDTGKLKTHQASGFGGLPAEVYRMGGAAATVKLTNLFTLC